MSTTNLAADLQRLRAAFAEYRSNQQYHDNVAGRLFEGNVTGTLNGTPAATVLTDISDALAAAAGAQAAADGKITTFYAATAPTAEGVGDLWVDTSDGNVLHRWNGTIWAEVQDNGIGQALSDAAGAQATADGKIVTFYAPSAPYTLTFTRTTTRHGLDGRLIASGDPCYEDAAAGFGKAVMLEEATVDHGAETLTSLSSGVLSNAKGSVQCRIESLRI